MINLMQSKNLDSTQIVVYIIVYVLNNKKLQVKTFEIFQTQSNIL